jgi:transcriptional regulator with XRE-family HTH domain
MLDIANIGLLIAAKRHKKGLTQIDLAKKTGLSRATLNALENGRLSELGFNKIVRILAALDCDMQVANVLAKRPTLEDLMTENANDKGLDGRR